MPDTVSPDCRPRIAAPYPPGWDVAPQTAADWKELAAGSAAGGRARIKAIRERLAIRVEAKPDRRRAGLRSSRRRSSRRRTATVSCVHLHGGGYVLFPGEAGAGEAMLMAGYGVQVVSVDYRMPPDFPFPAALDDAMAVWRDLVGRTTRVAWRSSAARPAAD